MSAEDFLRRLYRQKLISRRELYRRMAAVEALKQGKLRPRLGTKEPAARMAA